MRAKFSKSNWLTISFATTIFFVMWTGFNFKTTCAQIGFQNLPQIDPAANSQALPMTEAERTRILKEVSEWYEKEDWNSTKWNLIFNGASYGAALFSAMAALILQLRLNKQSRVAKQQKNIAATLAALAALLITLSTSGDFRRKWENHRDSKYDLELLKSYCNSSNATSLEARKRFDAIILGLKNRDKTSIR